MSTIGERRGSADQPKNDQCRGDWLFSIKRSLLGLAILLLALPILGFSYETISAAIDTRHFPPPGKLVAVDGHQMHMNCTGAGSH